MSPEEKAERKELEQLRKEKSELLELEQLRKEKTAAAGPAQLGKGAEDLFRLAYTGATGQIYPEMEATSQKIIDIFRPGKQPSWTDRRQQILDMIEQSRQRTGIAGTAAEAGGIIAGAKGLGGLMKFGTQIPQIAPYITSKVQQFAYPTQSAAEGVIRARGKSLKGKGQSAAQWFLADLLGQEALPAVMKSAAAGTKWMSNQGKKLYRWVMRRQDVGKYIETAQDKLANLLGLGGAKWRQACNDIADLESDFGKQKLLIDTLLQESDLKNFKRTSQIIDAWKKTTDIVGKIDIPNFYKDVDKTGAVSIDPKDLARRLRDQLQSGSTGLDEAALKKAMFTIKKLENIPKVELVMGRMTFQDTHEFIKEFDRVINWTSKDPKHLQEYVKGVRKNIQDEMFDLIDKQVGKEYVTKIKGLNAKYHVLAPVDIILDAMRDSVRPGSSHSKEKMRSIIGSSIYSAKYHLEHWQEALAFKVLQQIESGFKGESRQIKSIAKNYKKYLSGINWDKVEDGGYFQGLMEKFIGDIEAKGITGRAASVAAMNLHEKLFDTDASYRNEFKKASGETPEDVTQPRSAIPVPTPTPDPRFQAPQPTGY